MSTHKTVNFLSKDKRKMLRNELMFIEEKEIIHKIMDPQNETEVRSVTFEDGLLVIDLEDRSRTSSIKIGGNLLTIKD